MVICWTWFNNETQQATVTSGSVSGFTITGPGTGYSQSNPPVVLVGTNEIVREESVSNYRGDGGVLVGITTIASSQPQLVFDTFIPINYSLEIVPL